MASGLESGGNMWNYRIVKEGSEISIKEVFYDADKKPIMYGSSHLALDLEREEPVENEAVHIANMLHCMADALNSPILNADDFKRKEEVNNPTETMH